MAELALKYILGRKRGMTQRFTEDGLVVPVTVVTAGPCYVTQLRASKQNPNYCAVQLGFEECRAKVISKPVLGELGVQRGKPSKTAAASDASVKVRVGKALRFLREARVKKLPEATVGDVVLATSFTKGELVDVIGTSKGRGFMGTIRAHHFSRGPASHGSMNIRQPGSVGSSADPSHTFRGTRMGKHLGAIQSTTKNIKVFDVDGEKNLIYVCGPVAGPTGGFVIVRAATTPPPAPKAQPIVKKGTQKGGPEKGKK
ncbi:MAG: 50S ribosomal protein L3 [Planctomycetes bacterium]|nr:50S ribosomal protein L3 [Planctomycetota bacterium]